MIQCHCGSGLFFEICCKPFLLEKKKPERAEELMRSRYSAYVISNIEYILKTTHISTRKNYDFDELSIWAKSNQWIRLEILQVEKGLDQDSVGYVEFKAHYKQNGIKSFIHQEYSHFVKEKDQWYFLNGIQK